MLPVRWKIFRVVSYIHMTFTAVITALGVAAIFGTSFNYRSFEQIIVLFLLFLVPVSLLANSSINLFLLDRYFPDRLPGKALRRFSVILFILALLSDLAVLLVAIFGFADELSRSSDQLDVVGIVAASAIAAIGLTGAYILWLQVSLRKLIRRNHELVFDNFLEPEESTR